MHLAFKICQRIFRVSNKIFWKWLRHWPDILYFKHYYWLTLRRIFCEWQPSTFSCPVRSCLLMLWESVHMSSLLSGNWCHCSRGIFKGPYHSTCGVVNFWLPTVGCWIIEEFLCYTLKFALFVIKTNRFVFYSRLFGANPKILTDNRHDSRKSRVLICNINTPLHCTVGPNSIPVICKHPWT